MVPMADMLNARFEHDNVSGTVLYFYPSCHHHLLRRLVCSTKSSQCRW
jgi:hypothetical protein